MRARNIRLLACASALLLMSFACSSGDSNRPTRASGGKGGHGTDAGSDGSGGSGGSIGGTTSKGGMAGVAGADGASGETSTGDAGPSKPWVGVYVGNSTDDVIAFETWLGRKVDGVLGYTGGASWSDFDGSVGWAIGLWSPLDRRIFWSVPLIPKGATLADAAAGSFNSHYQMAAQQLAKFRPQDAVIDVRTGWECNGDWFPWAAQGKEEEFKNAFRQFVTTFRAESNRFRFEWNANIGNNTTTQMNPEAAYPGDDVVDVIGMDFYWNTQWDPADPIQAWNSARDRTYGLAWHQQFAASHAKPTSYSEWGIMSDAAGPYIEQAKLWFESHDVIYHNYWNSNSDFQGKLSDGQYPNAGAAWIKAFGTL